MSNRVVLGPRRLKAASMSRVTCALALLSARERCEACWGGRKVAHLPIQDPPAERIARTADDASGATNLSDIRSSSRGAAAHHPCAPGQPLSFKSRTAPAANRAAAPKLFFLGKGQSARSSFLVGQGPPSLTECGMHSEVNETWLKTISHERDGKLAIRAKLMSESILSETGSLTY